MANRKNDFNNALNSLIEEKGLDRTEFIEMLKESIIKAYKKIYLSPESEVRLDIDEATGHFNLFEIRTVVDNLDDEDLEIDLETANSGKRKYQIGDKYETKANMAEISRLAAIQTKQLFFQKIREKEKENLYNEFVEKKDDIVTGIVDRIEPKFTIVNIGKTGAFLASNQLIPGEKLVEGQHLKVYVSEVDQTTKGTHIVVSRTDPNFVKRLFELEVPEVYDGIVRIVSVAREAGQRTKIAVTCDDPNIDPIGSCIGPKGSRVRNVVTELNGEMIDIVNYSDNKIQYIKNALSPSDVLSVKLSDDNKSAIVIVPDSQLSLAIGKKGQNARLAVHLTGIKIDIKCESDAVEDDYYHEIEVNEPDYTIDIKEDIIEEISQEDAEAFLKAIDSIEPEVEEVIVEDVIIPDSMASYEQEIQQEITDEIEEATDEEITEFDLEDEELDEEFDSDDLDEEDEEYDSKYDEEIDYDAYEEYYE